MKRLSYVLIICVSIFLLIVTYSKEVSIGNQQEPKLVQSDISRVVDAKSLSAQEIKTLDSNLKKNENVLVTFIETENKFDDVMEKLIVGNYTKENIPYVIFVYNPQAKTLNTFSSSKEILDFKDISLSNVDSYLEVYKYLGEIKSKMMVLRSSQWIPPLYITGSYLILTIIILIIFFALFKSVIERCIMWENACGFEYKENFLGNKLKVKPDFLDEDVRSIRTKKPIKDSKEYFLLSKDEDFIVLRHSIIARYRRDGNTIVTEDFPKKLPNGYEYSLERNNIN